MTGRARCALRLLWFLPAFAASTARAVDDAGIYALIGTLKPVAEAITVDGNPADWGAIRAFSDPSGDAGGDPSRDIASVRIAPTGSALAILIQTAGANNFESLPLGISDAKVGLNPTAVDPWRRDLPSWGIREGFFVLPEPGADLVFVVGVALIALQSQIRRVRASSAARAPQAAPRRLRARP